MLEELASFLDINLQISWFHQVEASSSSEKGKGDPGKLNHFPSSALIFTLRST